MPSILPVWGFDQDGKIEWRETLVVWVEKIEPVTFDEYRRDR